MLPVVTRPSRDWSPLDLFICTQPFHIQWLNFNVQARVRSRYCVGSGSSVLECVGMRLWELLLGLSKCGIGWNKHILVNNDNKQPKKRTKNAEDDVKCNVIEISVNFTYAKNSFRTDKGCQYDCRDVILRTPYTYIQLVMPLREEWKSSPIRVDPQAVAGGRVRSVFKTKLVIILLWAVWIHIILIWSGFNEIKRKIKIYYIYIACCTIWPL